MQRASPPDHSGTLTNLAGSAVGVDWRKTFLMWVVAVQYINLFLALWPVVVPEASRGVIGLAERDLHIRPAFIVVMFLFSIGITWRGIHPRWWLLLVLTGQGVTTLIVLAFTIHSDITLTQLAGHGGMFALSLFGLIAMIPIHTDYPRLNRLIRISKLLLIPIIGIALLFYAVGIATRTDAGISMFIQSQFGLPLMVFLVIALGVGSACVVQNHISASSLFVALVPQGVYAVLAIALLGTDNSISLMGVFVHIEFTITALFVVFIQTKEYARALMLRSRQGAVYGT